MIKFTIGAPKDLDELKQRITEFYDFNKPSSEYPVSPRLFRISLGVSKQTLSNWKYNESKREWFDLIKTHEDLLLAFIEQRTLDLSCVSKDEKINIIGLLNTLRSYDSEQYIPEMRKDLEENTHKEPIVINAINSSANKIMNKLIKKE